MSQKSSVNVGSDGVVTCGTGYIASQTNTKTIPVSCVSDDYVGKWVRKDNPDWDIQCVRGKICR